MLPKGFDKTTAASEIAVHGDALDDPDFSAAGDVITYQIELHEAPTPYRVTAELWYEPIGYRWAHNLDHYDAPEPRQFSEQYDSLSAVAAAKIASATTSWAAAPTSR